MSKLSRFIHFYTDEDDGNGREEPFVLKTVKAAIIHITDALAKPAKKFTATLEPIQDLHGQDAPYPAGGGKNKINISPIEMNQAGGYANKQDLNTSIPAGTYTVSITSSLAAAWTFNLYDSDGNNVGSCASDTSNAGRQSKTFTTSATATKFGGYVNAATTLSDFQLELGSTATAYAPYSNICPITGHTGANVYRSGADTSNPTTYSVTFPQGKNLFDGSFLQGYWAYANGAFAEDTHWVTTDKIPCKASTYYTASASEKLTRWQGFVWYDSSGAFISTSNEQTNANIGLTKQSPSNAAYMVFNIAGYPGSSATVSPSDVENFQIEEGQTASSYEPNLYCYRGKLEIGENGNCTITNEYKSTILFGMEAWVKSAASDETRALYYLPLLDSKPSGGDSNPNKIYMYSSVYEVKDKTYSSAKGASVFCLGIGSASGHSAIGINVPSSISTIALLKQWLAQNHIQLVYPIETPIVHTLSQQQVITLLSGENNVWSDASDDLELQYYAKAESTP